MKCRFIPVVAALSLCGCDGEGPDAEPTVPVSGVATYQGKPLEGYTIFFGNLSNRAATGGIDADGRFFLGTNAPGDGAPVGLHKIWFSFEPFPQGSAGVPDINAPRQKPKVEIPRKYLSFRDAGLMVKVPEAGLTDYKLELD